MGILDLQSTITGKKQSVDGLSNRMEGSEERINKFEELKENRLGKKTQQEQTLRDL